MTPLRVRFPASRERERRYIFDVLLHHFLGLEFTAEPHDQPDVRISSTSGTGELVIDDYLLGLPAEQWLKPTSLPKRPIRWLEVPESLLSRNDRAPAQIPALYPSPNSDLMVDTPAGVRLSFDLFGAAFFMLTRYEELVVADRDSLDRFPAAASLSVQEGFIERPVVNEWLEILWAACCMLWPHLRRAKRSYSAMLTHDVDEVSLLGRSSFTVVRSIGADLFKRKEPSVALRKLKAWRHSVTTGTVSDADPYNSFDFLMDVSELHNLKSSFYFIPGWSHAYDARYTLDDPWIRALMRRINDRGHEIGYHASYNTYKDSQRTATECDSLRRACSEEGIHQHIQGGRQHYLRWANPATWDNWEKSKMAYDSTLTFPERAGFRCGCCYEFPVMNLLTGERLNLLERPLIAMENSLLGYSQFSLTDSEQKFKDLIGTCKRYAGTFVLLWHNSSLASDAARNTYSRIVEMAVGSGVPVAEKAIQTL